MTNLIGLFRVSLDKIEDKDDFALRFRVYEKFDEIHASRGTSEYQRLWEKTRGLSVKEVAKQLGIG